MAKCNQLTPLPFKGLNKLESTQRASTSANGDQC